MSTLTITRPDDWHIHLRDGDALQQTVTDVARYFGRAIIMPNLTPPTVSVDNALAYRERILAARPTGSHFDPLMTLYLTDNTSADTIKAAAANPYIYAVKLYPAGATTNSDAGVTDLEKNYDAIAAMEELGLPLLVHGEVTDDHIDVFDREKVFINTQLIPLKQRFPNLKVVLEHITTKDAVDFVKSCDNNQGATITAHHLLYNRNHMLVGGIKPHYYCLPILKRNTHQQALLEAATSGDPRFFLGTDSAPHSTQAKEQSCGCAGCYTAYAAVEMYAEVFEQMNALDKLENFASHFGPDFYGLPYNDDTITLNKQSWQAPEQLPLGNASLTPLRAGETLHWKIAN